MFALCESLKFCLPEAGGLYDQDPELSDKWIHILGKRAEKEKAERKKQEQKSKAKGAIPGRGAGRVSRPRRAR